MRVGAATQRRADRGAVPAACAESARPPSEGPGCKTPLFNWIHLRRLASDDDDDDDDNNNDNCRECTHPEASSPASVAQPAALGARLQALPFDV